MLKEERGYIRSIDVAEKLGVTKPSVSYATKRLRESGYITLDPAGMIVLLPPGLEIAERMYERHRPAGRLRDRARPERGDLRRHPQARPAVSLSAFLFNTSEHATLVILTEGAKMQEACSNTHMSD